MLKMWIFTGISFLVSLISMPIIIKICAKKGLYDYQDERKVHTGNIPRLGGIGIVLSFFVVSVIYIFLNNNLVFTQTLPLLIAGLLIFVFGIIDDILNLPALAKLAVQMLAAAIVTIFGFRFTNIFAWVLPLPISLILTFGWIIGVVNAYNLIDGLDGLCGSISFSGFVSLGLLFLFSNNNEAGICFILAAAILGFLVFNWPPAKIFMGDSGSQFLGFMIAVLPLYSSTDAFEYNKFIIMIILTSFPVFDTIAAIWRRLREKRSIMSPDRAHLHHKFLNLGYSKTATLYVILFFQLLLCAEVVYSAFLPRFKAALTLLMAFVFVVVFFSVIHYTNRAVLRKHGNAEKTGSK